MPSADETVERCIREATKERVALEEGEQARIVIDADEDKEWIQGNGGKRIGGHPVNPAGLALGGDDSNPSGKVADDTPEVGGCKRRGEHRLNSLKITHGQQKTGNRSAAPGDGSADLWRLFSEGMAR